MYVCLIIKFPPVIYFNKNENIFKNSYQKNIFQFTIKKTLKHQF